MEKRPTLLEIGYVLAGLPAVALIFLPFVSDVSPILMVCMGFPPAIISLLAIPILISTIRHAFYEPGLEVGVPWAYGLSLAALATTILVLLGSRGVIGQSVLVLAVGAVIVLAATRKGRVPARIHAHIAMLVAWMPNAVLCLAEFWESRSKGLGYHLAVVTLIAYALEVALRVREARRSEPEPED